MKRIIIITAVLLYMQSIDAQDTILCNFPLTPYPDSLDKYVEQSYTRMTGRHDYPPKCAIDHTDSVMYKKYSEAFYKCQLYLFNKLGEYVYCHYIDYSFNAFNKHRLQCGFQLPNIKSTRNCCGWINFEFERINLMFKFEVEEDNSITIIYPNNVPDCNGLPDCGFKITMDKAIKIAKDSGLLNDSVQYRIIPDGVNWILTTSKDNFWQSNDIPISIQTGQIGKKSTWHRID